MTIQILFFISKGFLNCQLLIVNYKHQFVVLLIWDGRSFPGKAKTPEQSGVFTKEERKNEKDIEEVFVYIVIGSYEEKKGINIKFL